MKVAILAGGYGTRISEETVLKPKPMIDIGDKPILWHIMKIYSHFGFNDFVICLGYKGYCIKEYFAHYFLHECDMTFDLRNNNECIIHNRNCEPWRVTLVDTGLNTMTGGRIKRIKDYIGNESFMMTYGDGVANVNISELVDFHKSHKKMLTVTAIQLGSRFGTMSFSDNDEVTSFQEKPKGDNSWINGGFFVIEPGIFDYIEGDDTVFEQEPLKRLTNEGELVAYKHRGFWQPMDTLRDKNNLEKLWHSGEAPWKVWNE
ncbi:MAG TPA: glucose-1-phosphate cytidylyltransferase [Ruminiclostridium sp.]|nr:glucose-1-phosphate cytidylyltransferase [Ruminiclostridium sp.]